MQHLQEHWLTNKTHSINRNKQPNHKWSVLSIISQATASALRFISQATVCVENYFAGDSVCVEIYFAGNSVCAENYLAGDSVELFRRQQCLR